MSAKVFKFYRPTIMYGKLIIHHYSPTISSSSVLYIGFWLKLSIHKRYKIITK